VEVQLLLKNLAVRGFRLAADGQFIIVQPASLLTDDDRAAIRSHKPELLRLLSNDGPGNPNWLPAHSIVDTCRRYGVALSIDPDGTLIVGRRGATAEEPSQPWADLVHAIEAHADVVADLVLAGWTLKTEFPGQPADA
jgi:hypothetical protein